MKTRSTFSMAILMGILMLAGIPANSSAMSEPSIDIQVKNQPAPTANAAAMSNSWDDESWDPFADMMNIQSRMNRIFQSSLGQPFSGARTDFRGGSGSSWGEPALDIMETPAEYVVTCDMPGVGKENIEVEVQDNILTVRGKRAYKNEQNADREGYRFYHRETSRGSFQRSIELPASVDESSITAEYVNGQLIVHVAKAKEEPIKKPVKVQVQ